MDKFNFYWRFVERPKRVVWSWVNCFLKRDNAFLIQKEADRMRNEFVLGVPSEVVLLLGWTDQYEDDFYWVVYNNHEINLHSCCGGFIRLKGKLSRFHYYHIQRVWQMNNPKLEDVLNMVKEKGIVLK